MKLKPKSTQYRWFWPLILLAAIVRVGLSLYLLEDCRYFFTLSADDVARYRLALLWANDASFFPDRTWPPLPFWLGGLLIRLFSTGQATLCGLSIAASVLTLPLLGLLCLGFIPPANSNKNRFHLFPIAVVLAVFVFYPHWIWLGTSMLAESTYIFLMTLAFTAFILSVERKSVRWSFAALFFAVLASMTRLEGVALAGIVYVLQIWRLRKHASKKAWAAYLLFGLILILIFPIIWVEGHSGGSGTLSYFSALKGGFASQYGYNPFRTPLQLIRMYLNVLPLILFLILVGFFGAWQERKGTPMRDLMGYQAALVGLYVFAQLAASALGMMPTHNFWRLTVPIFVILLPYLGVAFSFLGRLMPIRYQLLPAALCVFYYFPSFAHPPIFVTPDMYQSAVDIKEEIKKQPDSGNILLEVVNWEWLPLAVLGHGPHFDGLLFDIDPNSRKASNLNPPTLKLPHSMVKDYLKKHNVTLVAASSIQAKQTMMALGWKAARSGRYALFVPPEG